MKNNKVFSKFANKNVKMTVGIWKKNCKMITIESRNEKSQDACSLRLSSHRHLSHKYLNKLTYMNFIND